MKMGDDEEIDSPTSLACIRWAMCRRGAGGRAERGGVETVVMLRAIRNS